jgi:tetratricopeptide (TPR) repeat protein
MAEEDDVAPAASSNDTFAAQMAMNAPHGAASEAYLHKHGDLLDLQIENLKKLDEYETSHLRWRRFNDQMRGVLQMMAAAVAALVMFAIAAAMWSAYEANGVVIEAFSVPPDLAAKGLTGQVIATRLQDRLAALQAATYSFRAPSSYANNWGDDIKVQIPDTGVSIGELNRYLRNWLGHETHISGEVWHTPDGIAVTARAGSEASPVIAGREAEFDKLIQSAAEAVYRRTQPYRYGIYLVDNGRLAEARPVLAALARSGSRGERAWAHLGLASIVDASGDMRAELAEYRNASAEVPDFPIAWGNAANIEGNIGHDEAALADIRKALTLGAGGSGAVINPYYLETFTLQQKVIVATALGDNAEALALDRRLRSMEDIRSWEVSLENDLLICGAMHDARCVLTTWANLPSADPNLENPEASGLPTGLTLNRKAELAIAQMRLGQWRQAATTLGEIAPAVDKAGKPLRWFRDTFVVPAQALTDAELGDAAKARALIAITPLDCELCLFVRGRIEAAAKNTHGAEVSFARADAAAPSFPFVDTEWGEMLLDNGDAAGAVAKFEIANKRSPHFADPLEMWGEALIAQNRSDLALAKFEEASKYAPNWGRLHLKWGEALWWAGRREDAKKQFAIATGLDLSAHDKTELVRLSLLGR